MGDRTTHTVQRTGGRDPHVGSFVVLGAGLAMAAAGLDGLVRHRAGPDPLVTVIGYESVGHRHHERVLAELG